jgi:hypothetical protein
MGTISLETLTHGKLSKNPKIDEDETDLSMQCKEL